MRDDEIFTEEEMARFRAVDAQGVVARVPPVAAAMTVEQSAAWNAWADELIDRQVMSALKAITNAFGEREVAHRRELKAKFEEIASELDKQREENVKLRESVAYLRGVVSGHGGEVNCGEVIDLPAILPSKRAKWNG
jgi:hypothetical protein